MKAEVIKLLRRLADILAREIKVNSLVLFGSYARGEAGPSSDIDFIVVSPDFPEKFSDRFNLLRHAINLVKKSREYRRLREQGLYPTFSPIPYRPEDLENTPPLLLDVVEDGVIVVDDGTMEEKLEELREKLREMGAVRKTSAKGLRYWVLKPRVRPGEVLEL